MVARSFCEMPCSFFLIKKRENISYIYCFYEHDCGKNFLYLQTNVHENENF